jgi:hypothetical protein
MSILEITEVPNPSVLGVRFAEFVALMVYLRTVSCPDKKQFVRAGI